MQHAYDQVVHDVAIQQLPVRFILDRAGLVGADGPTHAGSFDLAYLGCLRVLSSWQQPTRPNLLIWSLPQWRSMIAPRPCATRAATASASVPEQGVPLEIGKGRIITQGSTVTLLSLGTRLAECLKAAETLAAWNSWTVADARSLNRSIANSSFSLRASIKLSHD